MIDSVLDSCPCRGYCARAGSISVFDRQLGVQILDMKQLCSIKASTVGNRVSLEIKRDTRWYLNHSTQSHICKQSHITRKIRVRTKLAKSVCEFVVGVVICAVGIYTGCDPGVLRKPIFGLDCTAERRRSSIIHGSIVFGKQRAGTITKEEIRLEDRMVEIRQEIRGLRSINFRTLLGRKRGRMNLIVSFLAILELMKTGFITIRQEEMFGEILIDSLE